MTLAELSKNLSEIGAESSLAGGLRVSVFIPYVGDVEVTGITTRGQLTIRKLEASDVLALLHYYGKLAGERKL